MTTVSPGEWQLAVGGGRRGPAGVGRSYREAVETLDLVRRRGVRTPILDHATLAPLRVLTQDVELLRDTVEDVLSPLASCRGGASPLVETLEAYFDEASAPPPRRGGSTSACAPSPTASGASRDPLDRFVLELAVRGCRLLPAAPFPDPATRGGEVLHLRT